MEAKLAQPEAAHLVWAILMAAAVIGLGFHLRRRRIHRFLSEGMVPGLVPGGKQTRRVLKASLLLGGLALLGVTLMRPQWGVVFREVRTRGIDILVLLDVSRSMLADDVAPNRLERSKVDIRDLLTRLEGDRIGLVAFAGKPVLKCPLTTDYGFFQLVLDEVSPDSAPRGGSLIGDAIRLGVASFDDRRKKHKAIILITDGEDHESFVREAAEKAAEEKIAIYTVGIGDPEVGRRIPVVGEDGRVRYIVHEGQEVFSRMNPDLLREVAMITGGAYVPASTASIELDRIYSERIARMEEKEIEAFKRKRHRERFQVFLAGALVLLLAESLVGARRRKGSAALLVLVLLGPGGDPMQDGNRLYRDGDYAGADARYQEAEVMHPESPEVAFNRAGAQYKMGDFERASELYRQALASDREDLDYLARYALGNCRFRLGQEKTQDLSSIERIQEGLDLYREAIGHWRDALEVDPTRTDPRHNLEIAQLAVKNLLDELKRKQEEKEKEKGPGEKLREIVELQREALGMTDAILDTPPGGPEREQAMEKDRSTQADTLEKTRAWLEEVEPMLAGPGQDPQMEEATGEVRSSVPFQEGAAEDLGKEEVPSARDDQGKALEHLEKALEMLSQKQPQQGDQKQEQEQGQEQQKQEARQLTKEEAERLLQQIREKERERKKEAARRARVGGVQVDRDW